MDVVKTPLPGLLLIKPTIYKDERGYFLEKYHSEHFRGQGIEANFIQDNQSRSVKNVLRGLHYQLEPYAQAKLIHVVEGEIMDVVVDLRKGSPTFGEWYGTQLDDIKHDQLFIPRGFAHGFAVISEIAIIEYKCDQLYHPGSDRGIRYDDPDLGIDWGIDTSMAILSGKDKELPTLSQAEKNFTY
jgi:dTDP-4-dehydrorhamnose 3,5-epimerase